MKWKETPQGHRIADAVITRAGAFVYSGFELGFTDEKANKQFNVYRDIKDLSNKKTLESFEGMTLTMTHPEKSKVDANDWKDKAIGHIQNVKIDGDKVVCEAYIKDKSAIDLLSDLTELRELSVGYEDNPKIEERNGNFYHTNIVGNHVAIVVEGRAGADCRLLIDHKGVNLMNIRGLANFLKGKRLNDSTDVTLTAEEINQMIASLEATLAELDGSDSDEAKAQIKDITAQLAELKTKLDVSVAPTDEATPEATSDALEVENARLQAENEALKTENAQLKAKLDELINERETVNALNDASLSFPKLNLNDAKSARDVHAQVLIDCGVFSKEKISTLTDSEVKTAYIAYQASSKKGKLNIGKTLTDSKQTATVTASFKLGGK